MMNQGLPNIRQPNLKDRVYELLLNMIIDGKYRENEMLPPERILCEELGVSRTVIREAVKSLETRGILRVIHGKGIRVIPAAASDISDSFILYLRRKGRAVSMKNLMEVRQAIETDIAGHAAARATESDTRTLEEILSRMEKAVADVEQYVRTDLEFHLKLAYMTQNILYVTILESLLIPLRQSFEESFEESDNERTCRQHREILERIAARDAEGAKNLMAGHLKHTEDTLHARGKL